jgi:hypothetical protein
VGLFATRTSCHDFAANQLRVLLAALAYVLIQRMRTLGLRGTRADRDDVRGPALYLQQ